MKSGFRITTASMLAASVVIGLGATAFSSGALAKSGLTTLYSFCSDDQCLAGMGPVSGLVMDRHGNLYGMTPTNGGINNDGTAYEVARKGKKYKFQKIYSFCTLDQCGDGSSPQSKFIIDKKGNLYGTATNAGPHHGGIVFELEPNAKHTAWKYRLIYGFCSLSNCADGETPGMGLTYKGSASGQPYDGKSTLYGATIYGGAHNGGVAFQITGIGGQNPLQSVLYSFCSQSNCADGSGADTALTMDNAGNIFGTTRDGGANGKGGVVFELSTGKRAFTEKTLYSFCQLTDCADGQGAIGGLTVDSTGSLLGTTVEGGAHGAGEIFKLESSGTAFTQSVLYSFCSQADCADGALPQGVIMDESGALLGAAYGGGTSQGGGTLFKFHDGTLDVLYSFCAKSACEDGENPVGSLVIGSKGDVLGATNAGGENFRGSVFDLQP